MKSLQIRGISPRKARASRSASGIHQDWLARQGEIKGRAVVQFALNLNRSSEGPDHVLGDGQTKSSASRFARTRFVDTVEAFKEARQVFTGNSSSEVANVELHPLLGFTRYR